MHFLVDNLVDEVENFLVGLFIYTLLITEIQRISMNFIELCRKRSAAR